MRYPLLQNLQEEAALRAERGWSARIVTDATDGIVNISGTGSLTAASSSTVDFDEALALQGHVDSGYPTCKGFTSWKEFFRQALFDRRNKIVHRGEIDFQEAESKMCFALATALFHIIKTMDLHRIKVMDSQLKAAFPPSRAVP